MTHRENALLLFAKLPEEGKVKTRLTTLKDGVFTPKDASTLFEAMLLDVVEICLAAFERLHAKDGQAYRLYISTAPAQNVGAMEKLVRGAGFDREDLSFITDSGASFDEHYNDAFSKVWDDGADCILSMGADMPALSVRDIVDGFDALHSLSRGLVISPDQEMGVSMIGWTRDTDFDHTGVFYNPSGLTVLPAYIQKAARASLPAIGLAPVPDVDTIADLAHNITLLQAREYTCEFDGDVAAKRTVAALKELGCYEVLVAPNELRDARDEIDSAV